MKCPRCQSRVKLTKSGVDEHVIQFCLNPRCEWQQLLGAADPQTTAGFHTTSEAVAKTERDYNG